MIIIDCIDRIIFISSSHTHFFLFSSSSFDSFYSSLLSFSRFIFSSLLCLCLPFFILFLTPSVCFSVSFVPFVLLSLFLFFQFFFLSIISSLLFHLHPVSSSFGNQLTFQLDYFDSSVHCSMWNLYRTSKIHRQEVPFHLTCISSTGWYSGFVMAVWTGGWWAGHVVPISVQLPIARGIKKSMRNNTVWAQSRYTRFKDCFIVWHYA